MRSQKNLDHSRQRSLSDHNKSPQIEFGGSLAQLSLPHLQFRPLRQTVLPQIAQHPRRLVSRNR